MTDQADEPLENLMKVWEELDKSAKALISSLPSGLVEAGEHLDRARIAGLETMQSTVMSDPRPGAGQLKAAS